MKVIERMRTLAVTPPAAVMAGQLLTRVHGAGGACPHCFEPPGIKPCPACGRNRGPSSKFADALIVGCLLSQPGEWTLLTYNTRDFESLVDGEPRVAVQAPPPYVSATPLLDYGESLPAARAASGGGADGKETA